MNDKPLGWDTSDNHARSNALRSWEHLILTDTCLGFPNTVTFVAGRIEVPLTVIVTIQNEEYFYHFGEEQIQALSRWIEQQEVWTLKGEST